jgi:hypothetical protein
VVSLDEYKKLHLLRERVGSRLGKRRRSEEDQEHEFRKRVKVELNAEIVDGEVGDEWGEVGKELKKWVSPKRYDKKAMALSDEEWSSTAKTDQLFKILESIREKDRTEKVIVFCVVYRVYGITDTVYEFF